MPDRRRERTIWVARLHISPRTAAKLSTWHQLSADEVRDAVECLPGLPFRWDLHPSRGLRAIVKTTIRGRPALVVLYPAPDPFGDAWNLGSTYHID
jgi:hypothetical protein